MENVPGIKIASNKEILDDFLNRLRQRYLVVEGILNSADYGVPQIRKRFVLHAVRKDIQKELLDVGFEFVLPKATHSGKKVEEAFALKTVREAIGDLPAIEAGTSYDDEWNCS